MFVAGDERKKIDSHQARKELRKGSGNERSTVDWISEATDKKGWYVELDGITTWTADGKAVRGISAARKPETH